MIPLKKIAKGFLAGAFLSAAVACTPSQSPEPQPNESLEENAEWMLGVMALVRDVHVDGKNSADGRKMTVDALNGMLQGLDPHSRYLTAEEYKAETESDSGVFGGVGIEYAMENGLIQVGATIEGGPSERAGIQSDDIITHIDGKPVQGMGRGDVSAALRGHPGTNVQVTVSRPGVANPFDVKITRAVIVAKQVKYDVIGNDIGYVRLTGFSNDKAADEVREAINAIQKRLGDKVKGYVFDLRNNPGGLLIEAVRISDHFLDADKVVVKSRGRTEGSNYDLKTGVAGDITGNKPVIVLINEGSASASELVSGALQDHRRAKVLGTQSYGKGSVQSVIELKNGDALAVTTALYYTPNNRSVQNIGITPDILFVPKTPAAPGETLRREADMPHTLKPEAGSNRGTRSGESCTALSENTPVQGLPKALVLRNKKADEMLLCAIDNLRGTSQYTVTQPLPKGP